MIEINTCCCSLPSINPNACANCLNNKQKNYEPFAEYKPYEYFKITEFENFYNQVKNKEVMMEKVVTRKEAEDIFTELCLELARRELQSVIGKHNDLILTESIIDMQKELYGEVKIVYKI